MGILIMPDLSELVAVPCPTCLGEGGFEGIDTEPGTVCPSCEGCQVIEVCPSCCHVPTVRHGIDVCGCVIGTVGLELGVAA